MQEEKHGFRDKSYSAWHRRTSTSRFIGLNQAQLLAMIDLDASLYVEYDDGTKEPLALIETAMDVGQPYKTATVTMKLSQRADIPSFVLLYELSDSKNPSDNSCFDIKGFRYKTLYPIKDTQWKQVTPKEWAVTLLKIREWSSNRIKKQQEAA